MQLAVAARGRRQAGGVQPATRDGRPGAAAPRAGEPASGVGADVGWGGGGGKSGAEEGGAGRGGGGAGRGGAEGKERGSSTAHRGLRGEWEEGASCSCGDWSESITGMKCRGECTEEGRHEDVWATGRDVAAGAPGSGCDLVRLGDCHKGALGRARNSGCMRGAAGQFRGSQWLWVPLLERLEARGPPLPSPKRLRRHPAGSSLPHHPIARPVLYPVATMNADVAEGTVPAPEDAEPSHAIRAQLDSTNPATMVLPTAMQRAAMPQPASPAPRRQRRGCCTTVSGYAFTP